MANEKKLITLDNIQYYHNKLSNVVGDYKNLISITYSDLKTLRDNSKLIPGCKYRITDYITTTVQEDTRSAGHQFDIIVIADDVNELNENSYAIKHDGDTYFNNCNLSAWELKYCLDNDINRFAWADTENGKGVIYYMKDEHNNECPYDFKNIQYKRWKITNANDSLSNYKDIFEQYYVGTKTMNSNIKILDLNDFKWFYTFNEYNEELDISIKLYDNDTTDITGYNKILERYSKINSTTLLTLNNIVLCCHVATVNTFDANNNNITLFIYGNNLTDSGIWNNKFGQDSNNNILLCTNDYDGSDLCAIYDICFKNNSDMNFICSFKKRMYSSNIGEYFQNNTIISNTISNLKILGYFQKNTIKINNFINNKISFHFQNNTIDLTNDFSQNTIEWAFKKNTINGYRFVNNNIGQYTQNNIFPSEFVGNDTSSVFNYNVFKTSNSLDSENANSVKYCQFGSYVQYNNFYNANASENSIQNLRVQCNLQGSTSEYNNIQVPVNAINEININKNKDNKIILTDITTLIDKPSYNKINHGTSDTTFTLTPNTFHLWDTVGNLTLTIGYEIEGVANEYIFQFISGSEPTTLILPDSIKFNTDFSVEENKIYQISILNGLGAVMCWDI